jgi:hypothetical protein
LVFLKLEEMFLKRELVIVDPGVPCSPKQGVQIAECQIALDEQSVYTMTARRAEQIAVARKALSKSVSGQSAEALVHMVLCRLDDWIQGKSWRTIDIFRSRVTNTSLSETADYEKQVLVY